MRIVNASGETVRDDGVEEVAFKWNEPNVFERGDKVYLTAPVQVFEPSESQIEEFAFAEGLKKIAPNDHILWLRGQYVEADNANANGAQWTAGELALKKLTPNLMPITVMHDPRTAVGTIADVVLKTPEKDGVPRARLETYLALWAHRFPEIAKEAAKNASQGTLMQSMECLSPWYECSECGQAFQKLPRGAEQAMWCEHLKASNPSAGYVAKSVTSNASRILGDVCFTGTGLIFGTRGAVGAYSEAHLEVFQEEVAAHLTTQHLETASGRPANMTLVQIEDSELATLRRERDEAKAKADQAENKLAEVTPKLEKAEADFATAQETAQNEKKRADDLEQEKAGTELATSRFEALGSAFKAKVEAIPSVKASLTEQAKTMEDTAWDARLGEIEALAGVKRDAKAEATTEDAKDAASVLASRETVTAPTFTAEELASVKTPGNGNAGGAPSNTERASTIGKLAGIFGPQKTAS